MKGLLVILLPLFFLAVQFSVISGQCPCESCITKRQFLERFNLIEKSNQEEECNPLPPTVITATPKRVLDFPIGQAHGLIAFGNYVFMAANGDGMVRKFDHEGNLIATFSVPSGFPGFLEIYDNKLYVTASDNMIYVKSVCDDSDNFVIFLTASFTGITSIRFTPDGSLFLVTSSNKVYVFNSQSLTIVNTITTPSNARVIQFDYDGSMLVSAHNSALYRYDPDDNFNLLNTIIYLGVSIIDGWIFQCDGSKILADRVGRVIFVDKDDNVVQIQTAPGYSIIIDVAITKNGALFVTDVNARKVFIY